MDVDTIDFENISLNPILKTDSIQERQVSGIEEKTKEVALPVIQDLVRQDKTGLSVDAERVVVASNTKVGTPTGINEPNLAQEMAQGLEDLEKNIREKRIDPLVAEANKIAGTDGKPGTIDLLLGLSKELSSLNPEKPELTEKAKKFIEQLKELDIDLIDINEEKEFTKENLADLRTQISTHSDVQRTKLQQIFSKIQTEIQNLSSIIDTAKKFINEQERLMQRISERFLKR